jgi:hypothetical protein
MICFVGSDSFVLALIASTYIFRLGDIEGALSATETFPKNPSCAPPITFFKSSHLAGASVKNHRRQDKLSSIFHLAALHPSLKSSCSNQQLPKLNTVFPVSFSTLSCIHDTLRAVGVPVQR